MKSKQHVGEVIEAITKLDSWIERNGWAGYDPYDIRGQPWAIRQSQNLALRLARVALFTGNQVFPQLSRKALRVKKEVNAKAMGLLASAYLMLYQQLKNDCYRQKAEECLNWLNANKSRDYAGTGWGYPFDWQSLILIPRGTPSAVVSSICGNAFWDFYKSTGDKKYLKVCQNIGEFFINSLNIDYIDDDKLCFSYTPLDRFHVHNANLFAAELLIKLGKETGNERFYQHGTKALTYSIEAQNEDGSFYYWSLSDKDVYNISDSVLRTIDHYHTGFVLRSLHSIYQTTGEERVLQALTRGYQFYRDNLFEDKTIPRLSPDSLYPIDIHSCAEAILCMSSLSDLFPEAAEYARNAFFWTKENMQDKDGHFYHLRTRRRILKIPYIRWGQAWMMRALSQHHHTLEESQSEAACR